MPFDVGDVSEPRAPIEVGVYAAKITNAGDDDAVAKTGTVGSTVEYELTDSGGETRPWRETCFHANIMSRILCATRVIAWVKPGESAFEQEKLDEFNSSRKEPAKAYLVDYETGALVTRLPPATQAIGKTLQVRIADRMNPNTKESRKQIVDWIMDGQA